MPRSRLSIALIGFACLAVPALAAQPVDEAELRRQYEEITRRPKPVPTIPAALRSIVTAPNNEWLVIRMNDGSQHRIGIGSVDIDKMEGFQDNRFIGFEIGGHEEYGYILVDRTGRGELADIPTGGRPAFSGDGRHFAAAEISESGFGNLNGVALWEIKPAGVRRLFYTDSVRYGFHWRADSFVGPTCVRFSAVEEGWEPTAPERWDQEVASAPRAYYELRWSDDEGLYFGRSGDAACYDDSSG